MYGTIDELKLAIGFQAATMAAGKADGVFDQQLEDVLTNVSAVVNEMVSTRVDVSKVTGNNVLKRIAIALGVYDIWAQYARNEVPETVREGKREAMKMLTDIQMGKITLALDTPEAGASTKIEPEFDSKAAVFGTVML